jgi:hypothetical protein
MSIVPSEPPRRRLSGDHGTALVEAGLLSPVFLFLILAIFEYGWFFNSWMRVSTTAQDASRAASVLGNAPDADFRIIQAVKSSTQALTASGLQKVVVFKATATSTAASAPTACTAGTGWAVSTGCNGYGPTEIAITNPARFGCSGVNNLSSGYCPTSRIVAFSPNPPGPDFIGVYLRYDHRFSTGLFGTNLVIEETVITRVEPQEVT